MALGKIKADTLEHSTAGSLDTQYVVNGSAKAWLSMDSGGGGSARHRRDSPWADMYMYSGGRIESGPITALRRPRGTAPGAAGRRRST